MAGYSKTPLFKKLGIKSGDEVLVLNAPEHYQGLLEPLPESVTLVRKLSVNTAIIHLFTRERVELEQMLTEYRHTMPASSMLWVSWPKKASKVATDVTEDVIREVALPLGWVDIKVCAVDGVWSGLKLVIRKELR